MIPLQILYFFKVSSDVPNKIVGNFDCLSFLYEMDLDGLCINMRTDIQWLQLQNSINFSVSALLLQQFDSTNCGGQGVMRKML